MLIRRVPGSLSTRAASVLNGSTQYWETGGLGLGANDAVYIATLIRRDTTSAGMGLFALGRTGGSNNDGKRLVTSTTGRLTIASTNAAASTSSANSANNSFDSGAGWFSVIGEWGATNSRRVIVNGVAVSDTGPITLTNAPDSLRIGATHAGVMYAGAYRYVAVCAGVASAETIAKLRLGLHPLEVCRHQLVDCWEMDRVGPLVGLVRGTILAPTGGGLLGAGPLAQAPPTIRRVFVGAAAGGTDYTLSADPAATTLSGVAASLEWARRVAADAASTALSGVTASLEYGRETAAAAGAAIISGVTAAMRYARRLVGAEETVTITGGTAVLERDRVITADAGTTTITGTAATLTYSGGAPAPRKTMMLMGVQK